MDFSTVNAITIPEGDVTKIEVDGSIIWELVEAPSYTNQVPISIDADGSIYNGCGYKEGYRVRSGGTESANSNVVCTGYIPFVHGDILRIHPLFTGLNTSNALTFYDAEFNCLGQYNDSGSLYGICATNSAEWAVSKIRVNESDCTVIDIGGVTNGTDIAYVRINHYLGTSTTSHGVASGDDIIVTVNEEIID